MLLLAKAPPKGTVTPNLNVFAHRLPVEEHELGAIERACFSLLRPSLPLCYKCLVVAPTAFLPLFKGAGLSAEFSVKCRYNIVSLKSERAAGRVDATFCAESSDY